MKTYLYVLFGKRTFDKYIQSKRPLEEDDPVDYSTSFVPVFFLQLKTIVMVSPHHDKLTSL